MKAFAISALSVLWAGAGWIQPVFAQSAYPRQGWEIDFTRTSPILNVRGVATVLDERTIQLRHYYFDGSQPLIFGHLGTNGTDATLEAGPRIGPEFTRAYTNESLILQLPPGQTLDGYTHFSIWCEPARLNLGSGLLAPPVPPRMQITSLGASFLEIRIHTPPRREYWLQVCEDPAITNQWRNLARLTNGVGTFINYYEAMSSETRFYRVVKD